MKVLRGDPSLRASATTTLFSTSDLIWIFVEINRDNERIVCASGQVENASARNSWSSNREVYTRCKSAPPHNVRLGAFLMPTSYFSYLYSSFKYPFFRSSCSNKIQVFSDSQLLYDNGNPRSKTFKGCALWRFIRSTNSTIRRLLMIRSARICPIQRMITATSSLQYHNLQWSEVRPGYLW